MGENQIQAAALRNKILVLPRRAILGDRLGAQLCQPGGDGVAPMGGRGADFRGRAVRSARVGRQVGKVSLQRVWGWA